MQTGLSSALTLSCQQLPLSPLSAGTPEHNQEQGGDGTTQFLDSIWKAKESGVLIQTSIEKRKGKH